MTSDMKVLALVPYLYDTAPGQRFRVEQWARFLEPRGVHFHFVPFETQRLKEIYHAPRRIFQKAIEMTTHVVRRALGVVRIGQGWDILFLHRELLPVFSPILEQVLSLRGAPIVYDFDDAIFLPDMSEANRWFQWLKRPKKIGTICRLSAHVIVGNPYLREYARQHTEHVSVVPTTIDTDQYTPKETVQINGAPVIGWSGSLTTLKHLRTIESALQALGKSIRFRLKVVGSQRFSLPGVVVESKDWHASSEVEELKSFDIGLMPLPNDAWSKGKCALKALQYMAVGVPVVVSPVGVNSDIVRDGENGFLAATEKEWVEKLLRLVRDGELRERFAREGRRTVENWYSAKVQAPRVLEILQQAQRRRGNSP